MTPEEKTWIDNASYEELLGKWRRAPNGSDWFIGETGQYFKKIMFQKRDEAGSEKAIRASKNIGW